MDNNQLRVSQQQIQSMQVRIALLDSLDNELETIEGYTTSGNLSVTSTSLIRRTCDVSMIITTTDYLPHSNGKIWLDKKFKLYIGIEDTLTNELVWFNKGIFYFSNVSVNFNESERTLSFTGLDKMTCLDVPLEYITKISANTPIFSAIQAFMSLIGETKYIISDVDTLFIPYDMSKDESSTIGDFLTEIRDLYMGFEMYYDENGYFIWQEIKDRKYDIVEMVFDDSNKTTISISNTPSFENIKNHIIVYGRVFDNGTQIKYELKNQNNNQFGIDSIGRRAMVVSEDKIQNSTQAIMKAEYELYLHSNLNEKISIEGIQNFGLDVNRLITVENSMIGISGNYVIESINYDLDGKMTLSCIKCYY